MPMEQVKCVYVIAPKIPNLKLNMIKSWKSWIENLLTSTRGHFNQSWIKWPRPTRAKKLGFARLDAITIEDIGIDMTEKNLAPPRVKFEAPNS